MDGRVLYLNNKKGNIN